MSRIPLLAEAKHEYKANLHAHTTRSDGTFTPEELRELYRANGYQILAYTDHHRYFDSGDLSTDDFLALSGYELNFDRFAPGTNLLLRTCHLCAIARDPKAVTPIPGNGEYNLAQINDAVRRLKQGGFLVNLNHPSWSNMPGEDILAIEGVTGLELFSSISEHGFEGTGDLHCYMQTVRAGKRVLPLATDDVHEGALRMGRPWGLPDGCRGIVMIRADELTTKAVLDALEAGHYYCSSGPRIHAAWIEGNRVVVDCSPVCKAFVKTAYAGHDLGEYRHTDTLTHVEFDLSGFTVGPFLMIQIVDSLGRFAGTVPYYTKT